MTKRQTVQVKLRPTMDPRDPKDTKSYERRQLEAEVRAHRFFAKPHKLNRFNTDRITNRKIHKISLFRRLLNVR